MKKLLISKFLRKSFAIFATISLIILPNFAQARDWATAEIFACEPEWGSLAKEIVGDKAKIVVATSKFQNPHFVQAKPSLISDIRKADIVFCSGSDLEVGWLPVLLEKSSKSEIQAGGRGYLMASDFVNKLETNTKGLDRSKGDIHPFGNPHIHLDPNNIPPVAAEFLKRILAIDPANRKTYQENYDKFVDKWAVATAKWQKRAEVLKDMPIVISHNQWAYLVNWLGLKVVTNLEEKPGIAPSSRYLFKVLETVKNQPVKMIIYAPFEDKEPIMWLFSRTNIKATLLPFTTQEEGSPKDLFSLFDQTLNILISAQK